MSRRKRINLLQDDSDDDADQDMKLCYVGCLKPKFIIKVNTDIDEVIEIKEHILEQLGLKRKDSSEFAHCSNNPYMNKIRLFSLKGGLELMNSDSMESVHGHQYLFYSLGEDFDHQVRMEFIEIKKKLGEGGFGSVYLAHDQLFNTEVALKVLNFSQNFKQSHMITKEIEALSRLKHRGIVKLFDYFPLPKKQQFIVVMEYLKGGELDDFWRQQPMRRFSEKSTFSLFIQLLNAIDYCHNSKIIHRDLKFQNIMLAEQPAYDDDGNIDISSVELKVVDFGIFGSIAGIRMENINYGSLKYMAPELLHGFTQSTTKIDIWSLGLMLHAMILGFLPFNNPDKEGLEKQIQTEELNYKHIKRLKPKSIKNEYRKQLNGLLRVISDDVIDLIEKMLDKDPITRVDMIQVHEHPWIVKYKTKAERWNDEESLSSSSGSVLKMPELSNKDEYEQLSENERENDFGSEYSNSKSDNINGQTDKKIKKRKGSQNINLQEYYMFNISENENETTGNYVAIDMRQKGTSHNKPLTKDSQRLQRKGSMKKAQFRIKKQGSQRNQRGSHLSVNKHIRSLQPTITSNNERLNSQNSNREGFVQMNKGMPALKINSNNGNNDSGSTQNTIQNTMKGMSTPKGMGLSSNDENYNKDNSTKHGSTFNCIRSGNGSPVNNNQIFNETGQNFSLKKQNVLQKKKNKKQFRQEYESKSKPGSKKVSTSNQQQYAIKSSLYCQEFFDQNRNGQNIVTQRHQQQHFPRPNHPNGKSGRNSVVVNQFQNNGFQILQNEAMGVQQDSKGVYSQQQQRLRKTQDQNELYVVTSNRNYQTINRDEEEGSCPPPGQIKDEQSPFSPKLKRDKLISKVTTQYNSIRSPEMQSKRNVILTDEEIHGEKKMAQSFYRSSNQQKQMSDNFPAFQLEPSVNNSAEQLRQKQQEKTTEQKQEDKDIKILDLPTNSKKVVNEKSVASTSVIDSCTMNQQESIEAIQQFSEHVNQQYNDIGQRNSHLSPVQNRNNQNVQRFLQLQKKQSGTQSYAEYGSKMMNVQTNNTNRNSNQLNKNRLIQNMVLNSEIDSPMPFQTAPGVSVNRVYAGQNYDHKNFSRFSKESHHRSRDGTRRRDISFYRNSNPTEQGDHIDDANIQIQNQNIVTISDIHQNDESVCAVNQVANQTYKNTNHSGNNIMSSLERS